MLQYLFLGFYEGDFDSNVISSFKEALKFSRVLFSILGDFALDGPRRSQIPSQRTTTLSHVESTAKLSRTAVFFFLLKNFEQFDLRVNFAATRSVTTSV